jgi:hypothetical protein
VAPEIDLTNTRVARRAGLPQALRALPFMRQMRDAYDISLAPNDRHKRATQGVKVVQIDLAPCFPAVALSRWLHDKHPHRQETTGRFHAPRRAA